MRFELKETDIFGLIRPEIDAHTLGISSVGKLLADCGYQVYVGDATVAAAVARVSKLDNIGLLTSWIRKNNITCLGFSYRLDPQNAQENFGRIYRLLNDNKLTSSQGGLVRRVYFAGLPEACNRILKEYNGDIEVFIGDETQYETLVKLGVPKSKIPSGVLEGSKYDDNRLDFAKSLIKDKEYLTELPDDKSGYKNYGTFQDTILNRVAQNRKIKGLPLMRVHVGPYDRDYDKAKREFKGWLHTLRSTGLLDVVSVGSSQLSQSHFGEDWGDMPNGGGVPINSERDLYEIWEAANPMLVRTYSSTRNIPEMAATYERCMNIAWHALSFWWFNKIDGRGPYSVKEGLTQHIEALRVIAASGKPFEPNIPHHFSFRGSDDYSYVLSSYLAAITAKKVGVKALILQTMLNTPKFTWGVQDLAKSRALLQLVRELSDPGFVVLHQPRAGLDYFSPDLEKAKVQLAAVSAMMDDIEPDNTQSPDIIHVVSYCEAVSLATPEYIHESIQITRHALRKYRELKLRGHMDDMRNNLEVEERTKDIYTQVKQMVAVLEKNIPNLYSAAGLYEVMHKGVFPIPYLWECREEFKEALRWQTGLYQGGIHVMREEGKPVPPLERMAQIF